jgi:hypothetical protein
MNFALWAILFFFSLLFAVVCLQFTQLAVRLTDCMLNFHSDIKFVFGSNISDQSAVSAAPAEDPTSQQHENPHAEHGLTDNLQVYVCSYSSCLKILLIACDSWFLLQPESDHS